MRKVLTLTTKQPTNGDIFTLNEDGTVTLRLVWEPADESDLLTDPDAAGDKQGDLLWEVWEENSLSFEDDEGNELPTNYD